MKNIPDYIQAGVDTVIEVKSTEAALTLIANKAGTVITLTGVAVSGGFKLTFPASVSYAGGRYLYNIYGTTGGVKTSIESGAFTMLAALAAGDPRTHAQKTLDAINAVIEGRATQSQRSVSVGDKTLAYMSLHELIQAKSIYEDIVETEEAAITGINRQAYYTRFPRV